MKLLLWMVAISMATGIRSESVPCPLDATPIKRFHKISADTMGGFDSDLVSYSTRGQFREHAISTCGTDLFSLRGIHLERPIPAALQPQIRAALQDERTRLANPEHPQVWERYALAARVYQILKADPFEIAEIYLHASWTARDAAVGVYIGGLDGPEAARQLLDLGAKELDKDLVDEARKTVLYNLARVAQRLGDGPLRDRFARQYLASKGLLADEQSAGERLQRIAKTVEPIYQDLAINMFTTAIASPDADKLKVARATYLLGDLHRRRGKPKAAKRYYTQTLDNPDTPDSLRQMSEFLLRDMDRQVR
jgi:hypothetical protein